MRDYRFENVIIKDKRYGFVVHDVVNFQGACIKAINYFIKQGKIDKDEFNKNLGYLKQNIERGETRVIPLKKEEQLGLDLEGKTFNDTFELLYKGLINEDDRTN
jgi:hypothetical protein